MPLVYFNKSRNTYLRFADVFIEGYENLTLLYLDDVTSLIH
jgi:hypothetical protein